MIVSTCSLRRERGCIQADIQELYVYMSNRHPEYYSQIPISEYIPSANPISQVLYIPRFNPIKQKQLPSPVQRLRAEEIPNLLSKRNFNLRFLHVYENVTSSKETVRMESIGVDSKDDMYIALCPKYIV